MLSDDRFISETRSGLIYGEGTHMCLPGPISWGRRTFRTKLHTNRCSLSSSSAVQGIQTLSPDMTKWTRWRTPYLPGQRGKQEATLVFAGPDTEKTLCSVPALRPPTVCVFVNPSRGHLFLLMSSHMRFPVDRQTFPGWLVVPAFQVSFLLLVPR